MSDDKTLGEIGRSIDRVELVVRQLAQEMQTALGPLAVHSKEIERLTTEQREMDTRVDAIQSRSAFISGGIAMLGVVANFIFGRRG